MKLSELTVFSNGAFCSYDDAKVGLLAHGLQYGTGCFEGIRGYWVAQERELYLVQLREHFERLATSAKILQMDFPYRTDDLMEIARELCVRNKFSSNTYMRPVMFKSAEDIGVRLHDLPATLAIVAIPSTHYIDAPNGVNAGTSSWRRADDSAAPPRAKITGLYVNSALAKSEALANGFDEAIMLSHDGHVAEGSAENIFIVRDGVLITPDPSQNVLEGCTRRAIIEIAKKEFDFPVVERAIDRSELYSAQEIFFTGTGIGGVMHVRSVDRRDVGDGSIGPITRKVAEFYGRIVHGAEPRYRDWVTPVYASRTVALSPSA